MFRRRERREAESAVSLPASLHIDTTMASRKWQKRSRPSLGWYRVRTGSYTIRQLDEVLVVPVVGDVPGEQGQVLFPAVQGDEIRGRGEVPLPHVRRLRLLQHDAGGGNGVRDVVADGDAEPASMSFSLTLRQPGGRQLLKRARQFPRYAAAIGLADV